MPQTGSMEAVPSHVDRPTVTTRAEAQSKVASIAFERAGLESGAWPGGCSDMDAPGSIHTTMSAPVRLVPQNFPQRSGLRAVVHDFDVIG